MSDAEFSERLNKTAASLRKSGEALQRMLAMSDGIEYLKESIDDFMARTSQPMQYSHRNGETEPPTIKGRYWFKGQIVRYGDPQDIADLQVVAFLYDGTGLLIQEEGDDWLTSAQGQWWGPVAPPWEQNV